MDIQVKTINFELIRMQITRVHISFERKVRGLEVHQGWVTLADFQCMSWNLNQNKRKWKSLNCNSAINITSIIYDAV